MIRTDGRGIVYGEVWFDEDPAADTGVDIVNYRQRSRPIAAAGTTPFLSLVTDLSMPEEAIAAGFGKDCRYKVKRADAKDRLQMDLVLKPRHRLAEFQSFFDAFAQQRSLVPADPRWLLAACGSGQLALSAVVREGEILVWHAYVLSGSTLRLQHSASHFRARENDHRALIGRANRWLHWMDMLKFRQLGYTRYDWGGLFEDESTPERAGVNGFKRDFGGREERTFDCTVPLTLKGRVYLPLRDAWRRIRRRPATEHSRLIDINSRSIGLAEHGKAA
jgi:hypothetical protein